MRIPFPSIPSTLPQESFDQVVVWQLRLLERAQECFGPCSGSKQFHCHRFDPTGPLVRHTADGTGVLVVLSMGAAKDWRAAVFELAHETIHLFDPVKGNARIFEEGVAVLFSLEIAREVFGDGGHDAGLCATLKHSSYREARDLMRKLGPDALTKVRAVRERCGGLSQVTVDHLREVYPGQEDATLQRLCEEFAGRPA
jgi:hypothetical protein